MMMETILAKAALTAQNDWTLLMLFKKNTPPSLAQSFALSPKTPPASRDCHVGMEKDCACLSWPPASARFRLKSQDDVHEERFHFPPEPLLLPLESGSFPICSCSTISLRIAPRIDNDMMSSNNCNHIQDDGEAIACPTSTPNVPPIARPTSTMKQINTSVTITDPLIKYHSLISTGFIAPDPPQHRLALHLQKIYNRLKDYTPSSDYSTRLAQISKAIQATKQKKHDIPHSLSTDSHPIRRNPLFARWLSRNEPGRDARALVKVLTGYQGALDADSPKGLFLSGEVGTGKSMLLDLLSEGLPTKGKRRWHFNTFMLHAFSQLELFRKQHKHPGVAKELGGDESVGNEYSLLWVAKNMVEVSPILFLDEFQLPDRVAAKIMTNLFTAFFQMGGVLVASSNRMPEDLENAIGTSFVPPTGGGIIRQMLGLNTSRKTGELFRNTGDFAMFLEVLKARCEFWHMEGGKDWRRRERSDDTLTPKDVDSSLLVSSSDGKGGGLETPETAKYQSTPAKYSLSTGTAPELMLSSTQIPWTSSYVTVYGRRLKIPRQYQGICHWTFDELVDVFGPADYITLASTFHTFTLDQVPVLTLAKKSEARRFITLLDALYECRCKLIIRAESGPDSLFFPSIDEPDVPAFEKTSQQPQKYRKQENNVAATEADIEEDATYSETISEVFQDTTSPFRPNISTYSDTQDGPTFNDQDMDFEGTGSKSKKNKKPDFRNTLAFTGEDERFAYKRAASRLWEMCSERWHSRGWDATITNANGFDVMEEGDEPEWWTPLPKDARHWEKSPPSKPKEVLIQDSGRKGDICIGPSVEIEEPAGLERFWRRS
ncbi:hypothetical protein MKZ38_005190 [Zalerion maritima]|uniref:AAA+ ATPase domain-containing protein n=1 Tax=Zalerion maritima TaxID=339359 RepID=A0AAD5RY50_9PEZI|nr:hypothetical protein MKZ38_005190 [Zalerion maritima]